MGDLYKEDLTNSKWLGIVVNGDDPLFLGRAKIRVFEKFDAIADDDLPWAFPHNSRIFAGDGAGSFSYPKKNTLVNVHFYDGDIYSPQYTIVENMNKKMQTEISASYRNAQVVVFDEQEDLKIIYTVADGIYIWNKGSYINMSPEGNITINHVGDCSTITLIDGDITNTSTVSQVIRTPKVLVDTTECRLGEGAAHPLAKGDELMKLLQKMALAIDLKMGVPSTTVAQVMAADVLTDKVFCAD